MHLQFNRPVVDRSFEPTLEPEPANVNLSATVHFSQSAGDRLSVPEPQPEQFNQAVSVPVPESEVIQLYAEWMDKVEDTLALQDSENRMRFWKRKN